MPLITPYVVARSTDKGVPESALDIEFLSNGQPRLTYKDLRPEDRDKHGNPWIRTEASPDPGRPLFDSLHSGRQRRCMEEMLCQVCAEPADRNRDGWLFFDWRTEDSPATWPERSITFMPPLCVEHARVSVRQCPFLGRGEHVLLRVRKPHLYGVSGTIYTFTANGWRASENDVISAYGKPRHPGMLAARLHRQLRDVTVVDLP
ncbi:hypothetical protein [Streptomyces sp. NBC_01716]|uniref:hypothetical protein n=1 Tax=Streptomyces sp. NBC_01716 TaxID=2975917 RepID=UPI002E363D77|nr:hypothetical protein [Streptomyces sp. NBC_01716]